jgi:hypothetical protein
MESDPSPQSPVMPEPSACADIPAPAVSVKMKKSFATPHTASRFHVIIGIGADYRFCIVVDGIYGPYLYETRLAAAQGHIVVHDFVLDGILQGGILDYGNSLALHEAHLDYALPEGAAALHVDYNPLFARLKISQLHLIFPFCRDRPLSAVSPT